MRSANTSRESGAVLAEQPRYSGDWLWETAQQAQQAARDHAQRIRERQELIARYGPELIDDLTRAISQAWDDLGDDPPFHELTREFAIAALQVFDHHRTKEVQKQADETPLDSPSPSLEQRDGGTGTGAVSPSDTEGIER